MARARLTLHPALVNRVERFAAIYAGLSDEDRQAWEQYAECLALVEGMTGDADDLANAIRRSWSRSAMEDPSTAVEILGRIG